MRTNDISEYGWISDAELVTLSRDGHPAAFGQIVERYQTLICALAYSACGDLSHSQDLAQQTFITAWRKLSDLREPVRLKAWLCGIVRNLMNNAFRQQARDPLVEAEPLDEMSGSLRELPTPSDQVISKEEQAILWRILEGIPRFYREPLVLFYRQDESVADVADTLELSEDVVRQRLSRGRAMLSDRVARYVETGLRSTGPTKAFTLAVLSALPAFTSSASAAGTLATTAKGVGTTKVAGLGGSLGYVLSQLFFLVSGCTMIVADIQQAKSPRERAFLARLFGGFAVLFVVFIGILAALIVFEAANPTSVGGLTVGFVGTITALILWADRRHKRIRMEEGTLIDRADSRVPFGDPHAAGFKRNVHARLGCLIFGPTSALIWLAQKGGDSNIPGIVFIASCILYAACCRARLRAPQNAWRIMVIAWSGVTLLALGVVNSCWHAWMGATPAWHLLGVNAVILLAYGLVLRAKTVTQAALRKPSL